MLTPSRVVALHAFVSFAVVGVRRAWRQHTRRTAGEATLPIRVYTIIANTPSSHVAALALLQTAIIFVPLAALGAALSLREVR